MPIESAFPRTFAAASTPERYVIGERLGGGKRYEVFRAHDRELLAEVVVKALREEMVTDARGRAAFDREVAIATCVSHPHLAHLLHWSSEAPRPCTVWQYVPQPSLAEHLSAVGPLAVPDACLVGIHVAAALHYLHTCAVLHLDVTPTNVLVGSVPVLVDLSLARSASGSLSLDHAVGTPPYMSPEQCRAGEVTPTTDVFGLGATLYEALSGAPPFGEGEAEAKDLVERYPQLGESPEPLRDVVAGVPGSLSALVGACLEHEPAKRPLSARAVADALVAVLREIGRGDLVLWPDRRS